MAEGILTLNPSFPERDPDAERLPIIEAPIGAGIGLALANMFKKRGIGDNNPPSPIEEEKPPQQKPPKGPDIGEEILTNLATRELEKKIDKDDKKEKPPKDPDFIPEILKLKEIDDDDDPALDTPEAYDKNRKIINVDKLLKEEIDGVPFDDVPFIKRIETERQDAFPFSIKDFKGGALDNKIIKEAFEYVSGDEPKYPQPFNRDNFLLTPPRGQQEIALRLIKQKLIEDNANPKIIKHITNLQNELKDRIKKTGYYGHGTKLEENLDVGFGLFNQLKRKKNAKGGMIDKPLQGGMRDI